MLVSPGDAYRSITRRSVFANAGIAAGAVLAENLLRPVRALATTSDPAPLSAGALASSVAEGSAVERVMDKNIFTHYASLGHDQPAVTEWVGVDLGMVHHGINRVRIYPREGLFSFPDRYTVQTSVDGQRWQDVPDVGRYPDRPDRWRQVIVEFRGVAARYVRVHATRLGRDDTGRFSLQIAELTTEQVNLRLPDRRAAVESVSASSEAVGMPASRLVDGDIQAYWSSRPHDTPEAEEHLTLRFGKRHDLTAVVLTPRPDGLGFPTDLRLQYSLDGERFTDVPGQSHSHDRPLRDAQRFTFRPVRARALRVIATGLGPVAPDVYAFQLAEATAEVGAPFRTDVPGDFDRVWNEMWLQYGAVADGQNSVYTFGNEPNYFEWMARKVLWANEPAYREALKDRVRSHPQNPEGYLWSWGDNPRWPSGDALHQTTNPMYILAAWRIAAWDDPAFLDEIDTTKAADVPTVIGYEATKTTPAVPEGGSLGQSFVVDQPWNAVGGRFPTYGASGSGMTLSVYRGGPGGELVAARQVDGVPDASWQYVTVAEPQPDGTYYLEMTQPTGPIYWWSTDDDVRPDWQAYTNRELTGGDRSLRVQLATQDPFNTDVSQGKTVWQKVQDAWRYLEAYGANEGLLIIDNGENDGTPAGEPSNYWDNLKMGHAEPYTNLYFYAAVRAMADLFRMRGHSEQARSYDRLAERVRERYQETFWDADKGRFVSTVDINGKVWDFGLTFLNLEAVAYGLATQDQAETILSWLDGQRTVAGDRSQGKDIYYYNVAPRANTIAIEDAGKPYWWNDVGGAISLDSAAAWDEHLENGGFIFYTAFYDILARHRTRGIDDAFDRMRTIASEYAVDEIERRPRNSYGADWRLGTTGPFPESGLVPASFVYTVLGADASARGLRLTPALPRSMHEASVVDLAFQGRTYDITVDRNGLTLATTTSSTGILPLEVDGLEPERSYAVVVSDPDRTIRNQKTIYTDGSGELRLRIELTGPTRVTVSSDG